MVYMRRAACGEFLQSAEDVFGLPDLIRKYRGILKCHIRSHANDRREAMPGISQKHDAALMPFAHMHVAQMIVKSVVRNGFRFKLTHMFFVPAMFLQIGQERIEEHRSV